MAWVLPPTEEHGDSKGATLTERPRQNTLQRVPPPRGTIGQGERLVVVFDFGGGTLDVALLRLDPEQKTFLVIDRAGDPHLGGEVRALPADPFVRPVIPTLLSISVYCIAASVLLPSPGSAAEASPWS